MSTLGGYDVVDDAIKIGLGALIGLGATIFSNVYQSRKELRGRRWDAIQKYALAFDEATLVFDRLHFHFLEYKLPNDQVPEATRRQTWIELTSILRIETGKAHQTMSGVSSMLIVVGADASAKKIQHCRLQAAVLSNMILPGTPPRLVEASADEVDRAYSRFASAKQDALSHLQGDFHNA